MTAEYLLALDAGSGSGRSVLISTDGRECHTVSKEWGYLSDAEAGPSACQFDADAFWNVLTSTVREVLSRAGVDGRQVVGVSSTSQREGCILLDRHGAELYAGPNRDQRGHAEGAEIAQTHGGQIYARTGHYPSGMFAPARLRWFQRYRPEVYERAATLLMINDWVLYRLSGVAASEPTNAAETCLFDIEEGRWADDLIEQLGLRRTLFREVVPCGSRIGEVGGEAAKATGIAPGTPVVVGGADTQCGALGSGVIAPGEMAVVAGTTAPLQLVLPKLALDPDYRLWSSRFLVPDTFVLESNAGAAGTVYRWFRDVFCEGETRQATDGGQSAFHLINTLIESTPPGAMGARSFLGVVVMNARALAMPRTILELGPSIWTGRTKAAVGRAILESLAFAARANADQISAIAPTRVARVAACGGLTNSSVYVGLLAACLERTVSVPRWREGSGVGAAICAGLGAGLYKSLGEGQRELVHVELEVAPDPALVNAYRELYPGWIRDYWALTSGSQNLPIPGEDG